MKHKAFFIMILILLAALYGAAQEAFVVNEGAEKTYFVNEHPGSVYSWKVLVDFSPDTEANPNDYTFISSNQQPQISLKWNRAGRYFLDVTETDIEGCTNRKILAVQVITGNRSVAFAEINSSGCFAETFSEFALGLEITGNNGDSLAQSYFPVHVDYEIGGRTYSQSVDFTNQSLFIELSPTNFEQDNDTLVVVQLLAATDAANQPISVLQQKNTHTRNLLAAPQAEFVHFDNRVEQETYGTYQVALKNNLLHKVGYHWWIEPPDGTSTNLTEVTGNTAEILWDGPIGTYNLLLSVFDSTGCGSDTISQTVEVVHTDTAAFVVNAGPDTTIGSCQPYAFASTYPGGELYSYSWSPDIYLDDASVPNPVFTPGETTTYQFTVSSSSGYSSTDTVTITVAGLTANAGDDIAIAEGSSMVLNGAASSGNNIAYRWFTENGTIDSGETTANPLVSAPGTYYLEVKDDFNCVAYDSVIVSKFVLAPVVEDIYDTTSYQKSVTIQVIGEEEDPQEKLDPSTLQIVQDPLYGRVIIDFYEGSLIYTPNDGYIGKDAFEYQVCNFFEKCDNAYVYVYVAALDFLIPEAFTPNGDNINDFFEIKGIEMYPNNSITIINRWGKKVYEAQRYGLETSPIFWDGKANQGGGNGDLPTGTYYYVLDLGNGEKPIAGSVYIDR